MSFSNSMEQVLRPGGNIVIGPRAVGFSELTLCGGRQGAWSMEVEEEYLARVRARAQDMAKDILAQAMAEAEQIKLRAREDGFQEGQAQGEAQLNQVLERAAGQCASVARSLQEQGRSIWEAHRDDLVQLLHTIVEKVIAVELNAHRRESLANLLGQAVDMIDARRRTVIVVHPQDRELLEELLTRSQAGEKGLDGWKIKDDPNIQPGGLILECDQGMVDNTIASRKASLQSIVDQLALEENG